jgi:hypothetical protein
MLYYIIIFLLLIYLLYYKKIKKVKKKEKKFKLTIEYLYWKKLFYKVYILNNINKYLKNDFYISNKIKNGSIV